MQLLKASALTLFKFSKMHWKFGLACKNNNCHIMCVSINVGQFQRHVEEKKILNFNYNTKQKNISKRRHYHNWKLAPILCLKKGTWGTLWKIFVSLFTLNKLSIICQRRNVLLARKRPGLGAKFLPWQL